MGAQAEIVLMPTSLILSYETPTADGLIYLNLPGWRPGMMQ